MYAGESAFEKKKKKCLKEEYSFDSRPAAKTS